MAAAGRVRVSTADQPGASTGGIEEVRRAPASGAVERKNKRAIAIHGRDTGG